MLAQNWKVGVETKTKYVPIALSDIKHRYRWSTQRRRSIRRETITRKSSSRVDQTWGALQPILTDAAGCPNGRKEEIEDVLPLLQSCSYPTKCLQMNSLMRSKFGPKSIQRFRFRAIYVVKTVSVFVYESSFIPVHIFRASGPVAI